MRVILTLAVVLALTWGGPAWGQGLGFQTCTEVGINSDNPRQWPRVLFINTYTGAGLSQFPPARWNLVDVPQSVPIPPDTKAVLLSMQLIITNGWAAPTQLADLTVAVRRAGSTLDNSTNCPGLTCPGYHAQAVAYYAGDGRRDSNTIWVAVNPQGQFELFYTIRDNGPWPTGPAYGLNVALAGYCR